MEKRLKRSLSLIKKALTAYRGCFWSFCDKSPWIAAEVKERVKIIFLWHYSHCVNYSLFAFGLWSPCNRQALLLYLRLQDFCFKMVLSYVQKIWNQAHLHNIEKDGECKSRRSNRKETETWQTNLFPYLSEHHSGLQSLACNTMYSK